MVAGGRELIDTLWNVNTNGGAGQRLSARELIDTLWNVNKSDTVDVLFSGVELIDTLWNVNDIKADCRIMLAEN